MWRLAGSDVCSLLYIRESASAVSAQFASVTLAQLILGCIDVFGHKPRQWPKTSNPGKVYRRTVPETIHTELGAPAAGELLPPLSVAVADYRFLA